MPSPVFDRVIAQAQEALRIASPTLAISQLTPLLTVSLTPAQQAHAHALLAQAYELQSQWDEAARLLRPYEDRARTTELPLSLQHLLCRRLASLYTEQGELPTALHFARQALHLAEHDDNSSDQGEAHQALGKAYRLLGQPVFARQHYQAALNLHQTLGARVLMARSYFGLSAVAAGSSEYLLARQSLRRAFNLVSDADDPLLYGLLCGMQASTLVLEETAPLAERVQWFARARAVFERIGHQRFLARVLGNWGDQLMRVGQWQEGEDLLRQALALSQALQDRRMLANGLESLAELYLRQGKYEHSQSYLAEALSWVEGCDHFVELQMRLAIARLHWQQGHSAQARAAFAQIVTRAGETEARQWQVAAQLSLVEMALSEGQIASVEELLHSCRPAVEKLCSLGMTGQLRFLEGRLALAQRRFLSAREALEQAHTMFTVSEQRWWVGRTRFALAEVLLSLGQRQAAHTLLQQAEQDFAAVAAAPLQQQLQQWRRQFLSPAPAKERLPEPEPAPLPLPESEGFGRLLRAVAFRAVLLRELLALLQAELPTHHIALWERSETDARKMLLASAHRPLRASETPALIRLEPWQSTPLEVQITPAPTLTPRLADLLQTAQSGLELCAGRERAVFTMASEQQAEHLERPLPGLFYQSQAMRALAADIYSIQGSDATVLLLGESGTGKELIARAIHTLSDRRERPFVPFNCATLPAELVASHLFGYRKGAFTGATQNSQGVIRAAENGTLFLDEIGELPLEVQPKLLRFLQEREIHPLGAATPEQVHVRVIAATNRALEEMVKTGRFREDLYYRLNIIPLRVPPLRERREEIPLLVRHFLQQHQTAHRPAVELCTEALDALMTYSWPGNVRQLENEMQRLLAFAKPGAWIPFSALAANIRAEMAQPQPFWPTEDTSGPASSLKSRLEAVERTAIVEALTRCHGNISQTAAELELSRSTLYAKLARYGLAVTDN
jgi:DNA-binding NtrC family response regulator/tetratricopeptide (TPR) repeat protein